MALKGFVPRNIIRCVILILIGLVPEMIQAQQLKISDFALFGGDGSCPAGPGQKTPTAPGCGVIVGNGSKILGGSAWQLFFDPRV